MIALPARQIVRWRAWLIGAWAIIALLFVPKARHVQRVLRTTADPSANVPEAVYLPTGTPMRVALTLANEERDNPHGVSGYSPIVQDPADKESKIGFGQHGGLGPNEQRPFLMIASGGFVPGERPQPSSLIDIAPTALRHLHLDHDDMDGRALPREPA